MKIKIILFQIFLFIMLGCTKHYMTLNMLEEQLAIEKINEISRKKIINYGIYEFFKVGYEPNGLWEVICIEKKTGKKVALSINKDTTLVIIEKNGKKHKLYFDTVYLAENKIYGLYSRFIKDPKTFDFNDIEKIEIHSELSKTRPVN